MPKPVYALLGVGIAAAAAAVWYGTRGSAGTQGTAPTLTDEYAGAGQGNSFAPANISFPPLPSLSSLLSPSSCCGDCADRAAAQTYTPDALPVTDGTQNAPTMPIPAGLSTSAAQVYASLIPRAVGGIGRGNPYAGGASGARGVQTLAYPPQGSTAAGFGG